MLEFNSINVHLNLDPFLNPTKLHTHVKGLYQKVKQARTYSNPHIKEYYQLICVCVSVSFVVLVNKQ